MTCIVAYDIENNGIRSKLSRFLEKNGVRLQKSVFAVEIERHVFKRFLSQIETIVGKNGKIAVFRLCAGCQKNALKLMKDDEKKFFIF
ncbi:CRISPR-associated Cas2 family protein [Candidatus Magnetoovum chiemensis]|nr:CRISPR-associated Cas2 family protein [Candidatus Magnetoovum chiemensis]